MATRLKRRTCKGANVTTQSVNKLMQELDVPSFVAQVLVSRGISDVQSAMRFMEPDLERDWLDPYLIAGMTEAIQMLEDAIKSKRKIIVYGDFDLDGVSATVVMTRGIRALGGIAVPFIPHRFDEGYGITFASIERLLTLEPDVVVTVDCGISCAKEVAHLKELGIDVVITDHHEPPADAVCHEGVAVVDPKAEPDNPSSILAGVGVALKVICALGSRFGYPHLWRGYTDFATLGTVADLMPMLGENRALVSDGIDKLNNSPRPCIEALKVISSMTDKELSSTNLGFSIAPRLNAAGRMGQTDVALKLLMSDNAAECAALAAELEELNNQRREIELELSEAAFEIADKQYDGKRILIVAGHDWHEGVKGIVASRLVNKYKVPTILFSIENNEARGSGRSVGGVDLFKAIEAHSDILTRFGGHAQAVGVTLPADALEEFSQRMSAYMDNLPSTDFETTTDYDGVVSLADITVEAIEQLNNLAPFGQDNPEPMLLAKNMILSDCKAVGASKNHLAFSLTDGANSVSSICFNCQNIDALSSSDGIVDAVFTLQIDQWRSRRSPKAMIKHIIPSMICVALENCLKDEDAKYIEHMFDNIAPSTLSQSANSTSCNVNLNKSKWKTVAQEDPSKLHSEVISAIIGNNSPHKTQCDIMSHLENNQSVLGIMATGRGKSLIFQAHAAKLALNSNQASVFIYPLRALMNDQAYHLSHQFEKFGLNCRVLNGETSQENRDATYAGLSQGDVDIVLTTPEYLSFYADKIGQCNRIGFVVIDEAHHIGQARAGTRPAYRNLGQYIRALGNPLVLALTATANSRIADDISGCLNVATRVVDQTSRDNLHIDDKRNIASRQDYLAHVIMSGGKTIVYVNSREMSVDIARNLRRRIPAIASTVGFYNAGLSRDERARVEKLFRSGKIQTLVATSAFGEGIDIPDVRHVILYHMPFSDVEFNQMSGRAGRDGQDCWVHLVFGKEDVSMNLKILEAIAPSRDNLAHIYRKIKEMQQQCGDGFITLGDSELLKLINIKNINLDLSTILRGLTIFQELGLVEFDSTFKENSYTRNIHVMQNAPSTELTNSELYSEGLAEIEDYLSYRDWVMKSDAHALTMRITHPITPNSDFKEI